MVNSGMVSQGVQLKRTPSVDAIGEGPFMCWLRLVLSNGEWLDMASIYVPPKGCLQDGMHKDNVRRHIQKAVAEKHNKKHNMALLGDINIYMY